METFSALLAICEGNSPVTGDFPSQKPVTRSFGVFFVLRPNILINNWDAGVLRRHRAHYDVTVMNWMIIAMIILCRFTIFMHCFDMIFNICYKLNLVMFVNTATTHTWRHFVIFVIGVCVFCDHALNRSWHLINKWVANRLFTSNFFKLSLYLTFLYRNLFDLRNLETRWQDFWRVYLVC